MLDIAIVGAGLGGLTAALRLHQRGFRPRIYEAAPELQPLGVGIAIQPYGTRELTELGLLDRLNAVSVDARESAYFNQHGQQIYVEQCGTHIGYDHAQRFVHRGILQMLLYDAVVERLGKQAVVLGARCVGFAQGRDHVTIRFAPNEHGAAEEVRADILIGADGINSVIREHLHPHSAKPHYSGITLWRGTTMMKPYKTGGTILHIGAPSQGSMIVYPILDNANGTDLTLTNWVVEQNGRPESVEDWNQKADVAEIEHMFDQCDLEFVDVTAMMRGCEAAYVFPLIDHDPLSRWTYDRVTMMGDSAHAMYPRGGNGACQALVDARVIAEKLATVDDPVAALEAYESERIGFVNKIVMANRGDGPEVVRRIVEERTGGARFDDIEDILPFAEADAIFKEYHRLAGMGRPNEKVAESAGYRSVFFDQD